MRGTWSFSPPDGNRDIWRLKVRQQPYLESINMVVFVIWRLIRYIFFFFWNATLSDFFPNFWEEQEFETQSSKIKGNGIGLSEDDGPNSLHSTLFSNLKRQGDGIGFFEDDLTKSLHALPGYAPACTQHFSQEKRNMKQTKTKLNLQKPFFS